MDSGSTAIAMAKINAKANTPDWWRKEYETLARMKARGIVLPTDEQYLVALKAIGSRTGNRHG